METTTDATNADFHLEATTIFEVVDRSIGWHGQLIQKLERRALPHVHLVWQCRHFHRDKDGGEGCARRELQRRHQEAVLREVSKRGLDLEPGKRYRLIHQIPPQRYDRESVMDFLGVGGAGADDGRLLFSARPLAGTQSFKPSWVKDAVEVAKTTPIKINGRIRGGQG